MGSFHSLCKKILNWVGDCINKVVKWFTGTLRKDVLGETKKFMKKKEVKKKIKKSDNPEAVGKVIVEIKALRVLKKCAVIKQKSLTQHDQNLIEGIFEEEDREEYMKNKIVAEELMGEVYEEEEENQYEENEEEEEISLDEEEEDSYSL